MEKTNQQFDSIAEICKDIYTKKMCDYGTAWRILRIESLTDQLYIKARRIREIEIKGTSKVQESIRSEYIGLINYSIISLIQLELGIISGDNFSVELPTETAIQLYDKYADEAKLLMQKKNHDYGEAWRNMRIQSLTDLILMKLHRIKQIENNEGKTIVSEGIDANYFDIINYAVFALIKIEFGE